MDRMVETEVLTIFSCFVCSPHSYRLAIFRLSHDFFSWHPSSSATTRTNSEATPCSPSKARKFRVPRLSLTSLL